MSQLQMSRVEWYLTGEAASLCAEISTTKKADIFVEFAPHIGALCVELYPDGWCEGSYPAPIGGERCFKCTEKELRRLLTLLSALNGNGHAIT